MDYDNTLFSQMAEAIGKKFNQIDDLEIHSCGLKEGKDLNKDMLKVMKNIGIDLKANKIKILQDLNNVDILVTLGKNVDVMFIPENAKLCWNSHIYENDLEKTRDIITKDIKKLLNDIKKGKF
jgi:protein-tyrosine-phosphatase